MKSLVFLLAATAAWAQTTPTGPEISGPYSQEALSGLETEQNETDWSTLLGALPPEAYDLLGAPSEILANRVQGGLLQVVHFHDNFLYLFWYRNRVWQIRADQRFLGTFFGLKMGMTTTEVTALLGLPRFTENDWLTYELPVLGFPRRLRLKFSNGRLNDLYFFRSDL